MKNRIKEKREKRKLRHKRIRAVIKGTKERPRLNVFKSNKHIWVQIIDDVVGNTLVSASDIELKKYQDLLKENSQKVEELGGKKAKAYLVGKLIAVKALKVGIEKVVFDRGGWKYHGRIKALADGAREGGLSF